MGKAIKIVLEPKQTFMTKFLLKLIGFYQFVVSPWFGQCCRFHPSCSNYAKQTLQNDSLGDMNSLYLIIKRLLKCHPWSKGGVDHPPHQK